MTINIFDGPCVVAEFKTKKAAEKMAKRVIADKVEVIKAESKYDPMCRTLVYQVIAVRS